MQSMPVLSVRPTPAHARGSDLGGQVSLDGAAPTGTTYVSSNPFLSASVDGVGVCLGEQPGSPARTEPPHTYNPFEERSTVVVDNPFLEVPFSREVRHSSDGLSSTASHSTDEDVADDDDDDDADRLAGQKQSQVSPRALVRRRPIYRRDPVLDDESSSSLCSSASESESYDSTLDEDAELDMEFVHVALDQISALLETVDPRTNSRSDIQTKIRFTAMMLSGLRLLRPHLQRKVELAVAHGESGSSLQQFIETLDQLDQLDTYYNGLCTKYGVDDPIAEFEEEFEEELRASRGSTPVTAGQPVPVRAALTRIQRAMSAPVLPGMSAATQAGSLPSFSAVHSSHAPSAAIRAPVRYQTESTLSATKTNASKQPLSAHTESMQELLTASAPPLDLLDEAEEDADRSSTSTLRRSSSARRHEDSSSSSSKSSGKARKHRGGLFGFGKKKEKAGTSKKTTSSSSSKKEKKEKKWKESATAKKNKPKDRQALAELQDLESDLSSPAALSAGPGTAGADIDTQSRSSSTSTSSRQHSSRSLPATHSDDDEDHGDADKSLHHSHEDDDRPATPKSKKELKREKRAQKEKAKQRLKEERAAEKALRRELTSKKKKKKRGFFSSRKHKPSEEDLARDLEQIDASTFGAAVVGGAGNEGLSGEIECPICLEDFPVSNTTTLACGHRYCIPCAVEYYTFNIRNDRNVNELHCPYPACRMRMPPHGLKLLLPPDVYELYQDATIRSYLRKEQDARWCPGSSCNYVVIVHDPHMKSGRAPVVCPQCSTKFCFLCVKQWHAGQSCQSQYTLDDQQFFDWAAREKELVQPCPMCGLPTQRSGGCNHMTCSCTYEWCWLCRKHYETGHYGEGGPCAGKQFAGDEPTEEELDEKLSELELERQRKKEKRKKRNAKIKKGAVVVGVGLATVVAVGGMVFTGPLVPIAMAGAAVAATGVYQGVRHVRHKRKIKRLEKAGELNHDLHASHGGTSAKELEYRRQKQKQSTAASSSSSRSSSGALRSSRSSYQRSNSSSYAQAPRRSSSSSSTVSLSASASSTARSKMVSCPRCSKISTYSGKPNVQVRCCFCKHVYKPPASLVLPCPRCSKRNGIRNPDAPVRCFNCKTVFRVRLSNSDSSGGGGASSQQMNPRASARF